MSAESRRKKRLGDPPTVADIMEQDVVTISSTASLRELVDLLRRNRISGVPVVDADGDVVGTVTITDLMWRGEWFVSGPDETRHQERAARGLDEGTVGDVMTPDVFGVRPDSTLSELVRFFASTGLGRAVVREGRTLVGIVSAADLLEVFADQPNEAKRSRERA